MKTCFGQLKIIRSSLQNLEQGTHSANSIHVIWDSVRLTNVLKPVKKVNDELLFLACEVLKVFIIKSKFLEAETKLKFIYKVRPKSFKTTVIKHR